MVFVRGEFVLHFVLVSDAIAQVSPQFLFREDPTYKHLAKVNTALAFLAELST